MAQERIMAQTGENIGAVCRVPWRGLPGWCIAGSYSGGRFETREAAITELHRRYETRDLDALGRSLTREDAR